MDSQYLQRQMEGVEVDRTDFIRETYNIFLASLIGMILCGVFAYYVLPSTLFIPIAVVNTILWVACGIFGWREPIHLVYGAFIIITGLFLGLLASYFAAAGMANIFSNAALSSFVSYPAPLTPNCPK